MKTIYKYRIELSDRCSVHMPIGAEILCAQLQDDEITIWARVDTRQATEMRHFVTHGTGHNIPDGERYIGTVQMQPFVWHIFEAAK